VTPARGCCLRVCLRHVENKEIRFDPEKNAQLLEERGVTFDTIVLLLEEKSSAMLEIKPHPLRVKYPHQHIIACRIDTYIYSVPCVIQEDHIFLKTIFASRKATKEYLQK
jgi:uncharacterized DUF497 family protein